MLISFDVCRYDAGMTTCPHANIRDFDPDRLNSADGLAAAVQIVLDDARRGCFGRNDGMTYLNVTNVIENALGVRVKAKRIVAAIEATPHVEKFVRFTMPAYRLTGQLTLAV